MNRLDSGKAVANGDNLMVIARNLLIFRCIQRNRICFRSGPEICTPEIPQIGFFRTGNRILSRDCLKDRLYI